MKKFRWLAIIMGMAAMTAVALPLVKNTPTQTAEEPAEAALVDVTGSVATLVKDRIEGAFKGVTVTDVFATEMPGMVEVEVNGSDNAFISEDGRFMLVGTVYELDESGDANSISDARYERLRKAELAKVDPSSLITFKAVGKEKAEVYAFTDITCPFCHRMQDEMSDINARGITVHYLAFPRRGLGNEAADDMDRVWCAKDNLKALSVAMNDKSIKHLAQVENCQSPVAEQYKLGLKLGVRGTPAVFTKDGKELGGYVPAKELATRLGI